MVPTLIYRFYVYSRPAPKYLPHSGVGKGVWGLNSLIGLGKNFFNGYSSNYIRKKQVFGPKPPLEIPGYMPLLPDLIRLPASAYSFFFPFRLELSAYSLRPMCSRDRYDLFVPRDGTDMAKTFAFIGPALWKHLSSSAWFSWGKFISEAHFSLPQNYFRLSAWVFRTGNASNGGLCEKWQLIGGATKTTTFKNLKQELPAKSCDPTRSNRSKQ
jgi:hypothetical protein